jgi:hypothetical protein
MERLKVLMCRSIKVSAEFGCTISGVFPASSPAAAAAAAVLAPTFRNAASETDPVTQSWRTLCTTGIQRVSCYYDSAQRLSIAGVVLESRTGPAQQLCRTTGSPGNVINVPDGVGIEAVTVASGSISRRVMRLEFRWVALMPMPGAVFGLSCAATPADATSLLDACILSCMLHTCLAQQHAQHLCCLHHGIRLTIVQATKAGISTPSCCTACPAG